MSVLFDKVRVISEIISRDATDTTYKYALLRGLSEICQEYEHLGHSENGRFVLPTGLLVEKWLLYYYPIVANQKFIPQKGNEKATDSIGLKISFRRQFEIVTKYYQTLGGFPAFYKDYKTGNVPTEVRRDLRLLIKQILYTITRFPMKPLGYSQTNGHYSIFNYENGGRIDESAISTKHLLECCGRFSIDQDLFTVFKDFGGYISGENAVVSKWAMFSARASKEVSYEDVMKTLSTSPLTERDTEESSRFYTKMLNKNGYLECVWSGKRIRSKTSMNIDHIIPFTAWRNNDLWNLMPADSVENKRKRDRIPSPQRLRERKNVIIQYWKALMTVYAERFSSEVKISLTSESYEPSCLLEEAYIRLEDRARTLIEKRGYTKWDP